MERINIPQRILLPLRLSGHLLKRLLQYNIPLSVLGACLTLTTPQNQATPWAVPGRVLTLFAVVACTLGFAFSVLLYLRFYRHELPLYYNGGLSLPAILCLVWWELILLLAVPAGCLYVLYGRTG